MIVKVKAETVPLTSIIIHQDDVMKADEVAECRAKMSRRDPNNKKGDDRSPVWTWMTYLYHDGSHLALPTEVFSACLRGAGARVSKGRSSYKEESQTAIMPQTEYFDFLVGGKKISMDKIIAFKDEPFTEHVNRVRDLGFDLFVKRVTVGSAKHVRVRPKFNNWSVVGFLEVDLDLISWEILERMFAEAGKIGMGDWRPGSKKSGPYGRFTTKLTKI